MDPTSGDILNKKKDALRKLNSSRFREQIENDLAQSTATGPSLSKNPGMLQKNPRTGRIQPEQVEISISSVQHNSITIAEKISIRSAPSSTITSQAITTGTSSAAFTTGNQKMVIIPKQRHIINESKDSMLMKPRRPLVGLAVDMDEEKSSVVDNRIRRPTGEPTGIQPAVITNDKLLTVDSSMFLRAPTDATGISVDISGRQLLCGVVSANQEELVIGSADHGLYSIKHNNKTKKQAVRQMYTKKYGHTDWVTSVALTHDSRVLSAGNPTHIYFTFTS